MCPLVRIEPVRAQNNYLIRQEIRVRAHHYEPCAGRTTRTTSQALLIDPLHKMSLEIEAGEYVLLFVLLRSFKKKKKIVVFYVNGD